MIEYFHVMIALGSLLAWIKPSSADEHVAAFAAPSVLIDGYRRLAALRCLGGEAGEAAILCGKDPAPVRSALMVPRP
jgi:hypothetical protein